ncbi:MAG: hypothetical protein R6U11_08770 [Bacteroidales bacterium]
MILKNNILHILLLQVFICCSINIAFAQNKPGQNYPNIIKDSTGQIIISKDTPLLLFIGTKPDGSDALLLKSKNDSLKPLELINEGENALIHKDKRNRIITSFVFFADETPPESKFFTDNYFLLSNDTIISPLNFVLSLNATDNIAGVKDLFVSVDNENYKPAPKTIVFDKEKDYSLKFYAIDNVGNKETINEYIITIDNTPPVTKHNILKDQHENILSRRSKIELNPTDKHGIKETIYWINKDKPSKYNKPISVGNLNEGSHTLNYYSVDNLGNIEDTIAYDFYIDNTPPMIFEEIAGNKFIRNGKEYSSGRAQLRITAIDNKAGVKDIYYSFDGKDFKVYEGPVFLSSVSGDISISSYALDNVNNKSQSSTSGTSVAVPYIDLNAPQINHRFKGPEINLRDTVFISQNTEISISATDKESGLNKIIYGITGKQESDYKTPFTLNEKGYFNVYYTAFDNVDNANTSNFSVFVDSDGPEIKIDYSIISHQTIKVDDNIIPVYPKHVKIYLSATDKHTGTEKISYILNNKPERIYKNEISGFDNSEVNSIVVKAIDIMGNVSTKEFSFFIK